MRYYRIICVVLLLSIQAIASPSVTVHSIPGHPLADAMGLVLSVEGAETSSFITDCGSTFLNPPYQTGWPVNISNYAGDEGGLLVNADGDPEMEILFLTHKTVHLLNHDGTYLTGWPVTVPGGTHSSGQPSFGDLDGDGEGEIVILTDNYPNGSNGWVYAYHSDGTPVSGFPATTNGDFTKSPTVVDLFDDGTCEIIVGERDYPTGWVYVFDGAGQLLSGWPQELNHVPAASAGAADLDNDGVREIVFESYNSIYVWDTNGTLLTGFPYTPTTGDVFSYSAPTFADTDGDGYLEIAAGGHKLSGSSHMFLINHDGTDVTGWPKAVPYWIYAPATFADMDGDDDLEVMVGDQVLSPTLTDYLYAWHHDGTVVSGWPVGPIETVNAQVAVADIDGDADPEFIWDTNITPGKLLGYHHTGDPIAGWPITTDGASFFNTVALGDVDGDGDIELLLTTSLDTPLCTAHLWDFPDQVDPANIQMPMFQYGPGRDGLICVTQPQGIEGSETAEVLQLTSSPNPFTGSVTIEVSGFEEEPGALRIFDLSGRVVAEINPEYISGRACYIWSTEEDLPAGVYSAIIETGGTEAGLRLLRL
jgi:hypothetical protein